MWRYYDLLSFRPLAEIAKLRAAVDGGANPRDIKMQLGAEIVARFHGAQAGPAAQAAFIAQFSRGALPDDIPTIKIGVPSSEGLPIDRALKEAGMVSSNAEGNRWEESGVGKEWVREGRFRGVRGL